MSDEVTAAVRITHARAVEVARERGIARTRDFDAAGVPRSYLKRLCVEGVLMRHGRGLYQLADAELTGAHSLAEMARVVPRGTVCLLSALLFHGLTTQLPHAVWLMLESKDWAPRNPPVMTTIVRASGEALTAGIQRHSIEGVHVPITVPAKTVADCFKYRSRVGLDVAMEALRECLRYRRASIDDIMRFARICRVERVMRPYVESAAPNVG
jgi:predicted transcriptional regulator of viral defense system